MLRKPRRNVHLFSILIKQRMGQKVFDPTRKGLRTGCPKISRDMVWYGVLAPYHLMYLVASRLLHNCFTGYALILVVELRLVPGNVVVQKEVGTARPNFEK